MITEKVYSPIEDKNIKRNLQHSPIWKNCYKEDETKPNGMMYIYTIKFDGLKPIQVTKISKKKN